MFKDGLDPIRLISAGHVCLSCSVPVFMQEPEFCAKIIDVINILSYDRTVTEAALGRVPVGGKFKGTQGFSDD